MNKITSMLFVLALITTGVELIQYYIFLFFGAKEPARHRTEVLLPLVLFIGAAISRYIAITAS